MHASDARYIAGWFRTEEEILVAAEAARREGLDPFDAYTPYPVHGLDEAIGLRRSRLTRVALIGALTGLFLAVGLQVWVSLVDWPMNIGGKPQAPAALFVPVAFELTVLFGGLATVAAFLVRSRLRPGARRRVFEGVTDDRFVLLLRQRDGAVDETFARSLLERHHAITILEGVTPS
jgi:hypothetical protein